MTAPSGQPIVLDVGGTTLRIGVYDPSADMLGEVRRMPVDGRARRPGETVAAIQARVADQITGAVRGLVRDGAEFPSRVGVGFAGPVTSAGVVTAAPTVWGDGGAPLPLAEVLRRRLAVPVTVVNDLTAAAWRYLGRQPEPFCVVTVSSGIGNKVVHAGRVMVGDDGLGGELGHWRCDPAPDALPCECGGRGHLGGIASGRGAVAVAQRLRARDPELFGRSALAATRTLDAAALAKATLAGDPFALAVARTGLGFLAGGLTALVAAAGVRRFVVIGGFAQAIGDRYADLLTDQLLQRGCFGLADDAIHDLVRLGEPDDDHALWGLGRALRDGGEGCV